MKAKKSFGQHFLKDEHYCNKIANSLTLLKANYNKLLEVGPGKAALTKHLLKQDVQLKAIEADKDMVAYLSQHYPTLDVISENFLKTDLSNIFQQESFGLIGNFPYNISSQILFRVVAFKEFIPEVVGMFQKEVAQRIVAPPGNKVYGVISVLIQAYYTGVYLFTVPPGAFAPPPKVQSGVIRLVRKENFDLNCDEVLFKRIVKTAFGQRRKMLRNTLKGINGDQPFLKEDFFKQRPEQLGVEDYIEITKRFENTI